LNGPVLYFCRSIYKVRNKLFSFMQHKPMHLWCRYKKPGELRKRELRKLINIADANRFSGNLDFFRILGYSLCLFSSLFRLYIFLYYKDTLFYSMQNSCIPNL
jgi:hypothetical protein